MKRYSPPVFVQLGRTGDLILLLPAFLEIFKRTGLKPTVIVSEEYADVLDGVSYVTPYPVPLHWWDGIQKAKRIAKLMASDYALPHWWNDAECPIPPEYRGEHTLQCHGREHGVNLALWPNFMASMYSRAGFTMDEMMRLPLVFDRRDAGREKALLDRVWPPKLRGKLLLLYNFTGISSPFGYVPELYPHLNAMRERFTVVDLGPIRATRIYDLLGLYDVAVGLITCDTATAHLAHASKVPTVWFTASGWTGSTPRGNVALHVSYNDTVKRIPDLVDVLVGWKLQNGNSRSLEVLAH